MSQVWDGTPNGERARFWVVDTGVGIDGDGLLHVFDRSRQARKVSTTGRDSACRLPGEQSKPIEAASGLNAPWVQAARSSSQYPQPTLPILTRVPAHRLDS